MRNYLLGLLYVLITVFTPHAIAVEQIISANIIEGQATVKNYIGNRGHYEKNVNGTVSYADAAGAAPVNGISGSPNTTCTRTTSSPLAGVGSLLITKSSGASRQGEGCSLDFTIDSKDKAKPMRIAFDYLTAGTYVDGDLTVWIYDITNSRLIQPSGSSILGVLSTDRKVLEFQTSSDSVSYRLIWHVAVATDSANTVKIDDIEVSRQSASSGSSITDWVTFTPTGGWTNGNTFYSGKWRRIGDSMEIQVRVGISGGAPDSTTFSVNVPSGYVIDTSKLVTGESALGSAVAGDFGTGYFAGTVTLATSTSVFVAGPNTSSVWTQLVPMTWASGDTANLVFKVPIVGWGTNQVLSSDTDTRVVATIMQMTSSQTGINPNGAAAKISIDSAPFLDTHGMVTASNRVTVKVPGVYTFSGRIALQGANVVAGAEYRALVLKNGSEFIRGQSYVGVSATASNLIVTGIGNAVAGDYFELWLFTTANHSVSTLTVYGDSSEPAYTSLSLNRLSGPAQMAASESFIFRALKSGSQTPSGDTLISLGTGDVTKDSHSCFRDASDGCEIQSSGQYRICAHALAPSGSGGFTIGYGIDAGAIVSLADGFQTTSGAMTFGSCDTVGLLQRQVVKMRINSGGSYSNFRFTIDRIGNY